MVSKTYKSVELLDVLNDVDEEKRQQRYLELIGHTNDHLYMDHCTPEQQQNIEKQHIEKSCWGVLTEQELSITRIESNDYLYKYDQVSGAPKIPYIKIGEPCAICFEPIVKARNAYYTECGHKVHKTCITDYYNSTFNNRSLGHSFNWKISCPICRHPLNKCLWLEKRYLTNPFLKKDIYCNLVYDHYPELLNHDIIECAGCECTNGCGNVCGSFYTQGCTHCSRWRYFTFNDLVYHSVYCQHKVYKKRKRSRSKGCIFYLKSVFNFITSFFR
jgi:hypothetical protein